MAMSPNELNNELSIEEECLISQEEFDLLRTFFVIYESKFAHSLHLPGDILQKTDRSPQNLDIDQKGHLFTCKECFSRFFSDEVPLDFLTAFVSQNRSSASLDTQLHNGDKRVTYITRETNGKHFSLIIDGREYYVEKSFVTGVEIMDLTGIPREAGLVMILEDGTQVQIREDEVVELKPGRRFKKAPRFLRG